MRSKFKQYSWPKFLVIALSLFMVWPHSAGATESGIPLWIIPPSQNNGQNFRELFEHPEAWQETRYKIDGLGYADHLLNKQFSDLELKALFAELNEWHLKFSLEVGAIKPWGETGEKAFNIDRKMWDRFQANGGHIYSIAMDEPMAAALNNLKKQPGYAIEETAQFIALVRKNYPDVILGEIEPYPFFQANVLITFIDALQERLKQMNVRGLDFVRLDVDWMHFVNHTKMGKAGWAGVKKIESECRKRNLPFSLIYWAADYGSLKRSKQLTATTWENSILQQGQWYKEEGGIPDEMVLESWLPTPDHSIPETTEGSFTHSVLSFAQRFDPKTSKYIPSEPQPTQGPTPN